MPCILHSRKDNSQFIHGWLKQDSYLATYSRLIHPIPDKTSWPRANGDEILPPLVKRPPGRPKKNRRRETDEVPPEKRRYRMQCKHCKEFGHNKRGCPINPENANKRTRHYKNNLKSYVFRTGAELAGVQDSDSGANVNALVNISNGSHNQAHENIQIPIKVYDMTNYQHQVSKKQKLVNQAGTSRGREAVNMQITEGGSRHAVWLVVQGKKILTGSGMMLKGNDGAKIGIKNKIMEKGKAPAFPPWR